MLWIWTARPFDLSCPIPADVATDILRAAERPTGWAALLPAFSDEPMVVVARVRPATVQLSGRLGATMNSARSTLTAVIEPTGPHSCRLVGSFRTPFEAGVLMAGWLGLALLWTVGDAVAQLLHGDLDTFPLFGLGMLAFGVLLGAAMTALARAEERFARDWLAERLGRPASASTAG